MPTPFMCHECDTPTMNKNGICEKCKSIDVFFNIKKEPTSKGFDGTKADAKKADKNIKACPTCGICWEKDRDATTSVSNRSRGLTVYLYYENFPTYGKQVKQCPKCDMRSTKKPKRSYV